MNGLKTINEKLLRAAKRRNEELVSHVYNVKERLFPGRVLQERYENYLSYYLKYGFGFFDLIYEATNPFTKQFQLLLETDDE